MLKMRIISLLFLFVGGLAGFFVLDNDRFGDFSFGLDISGGTHLIYHIDTNALPSQDIKESVASLRDVIERRVNLFGVSEPIVQLESLREEHRLIIELPGVTDLAEAKRIIGETPVLDFRTEKNGAREALGATGEETANTEEFFEPTELTGRFLQNASVQFDNVTGEPYVSLDFDKEGGDIFAELTRANVGKYIAIYLDGAPISVPVVREEISGGQAQISGGFSLEEAKTLVGRLNAGALPVPISLLSSQTIGPSLGTETLKTGIRAGIFGLLFVAIFLIFWYRLPGLISVFALAIYISFMLLIFKFIPVTLTAAGIAGFIMSIGMAVDANILIFERLKEELFLGKTLHSAIDAGFSRAWNSIRDANISSIITAVILFWFGTSLVEGFALTFGLGVIVSMVSAITVTRIFLLGIAPSESGKIMKFMFGTGIKQNRDNI